jgi:hypothetical protein
MRAECEWEMSFILGIEKKEEMIASMNLDVVEPIEQCV